ncbi:MULTISPECIES: ABC transporter ATP-binding protein [Bordetella]|uniref:ABC transporter ATP-binding protein n=2 Tax=Bordetella TaxID=517 RepID=A0A261VWE1_9BORD|nr:MULTISPECIES: ABC transporter ATP-binding protein [Bordetella]MDM9561557.1 ABC transporter ATP-binding protein [Bordetella petrii]OZI78405.1 ABC transporter ATP-binding protein [Bordetella genomosp. 2]
MTEPLLAMEDVTAGYLGDIDVLRNVSLAVQAGRISGLIGLNGAGKSTLMKTLCGFLQPKSGRVVLAGQDISGQAPHTMIDAGLWYIPQESSLFPYLSVADNLRLPLEGRRRQFGAELERRYADTLERFPVLKEKLREQAGNLSGGQQKSLEFAKAYMVRPRVCLIDEPSIGLAPRVAADIFKWIHAFAQSGMGILLVDHNVRRVVQMSHHVYVLSLGEITASGSPEAFAGDLHAQVREWLGINF